MRSRSSPFERLAHKFVDAGEKRGERLARAGGRGDQRGASGDNVRPAVICGSVGEPKRPRNHSCTTGCAQALMSSPGAPLPGLGYCGRHRDILGAFGNFRQMFALDYLACLSAVVASGDAGFFSIGTDSAKVAAAAESTFAFSNGR